MTFASQFFCSSVPSSGALCMFSCDRYAPFFFALSIWYFQGSDDDIGWLLLSLNSQSRSLNFQLSDWFTAHNLLANNPVFCLIRTLDAMPNATVFKSFRRDAKVSF